MNFDVKRFRSDHGLSQRAMSELIGTCKQGAVEALKPL